MNTKKNQFTTLLIYYIQEKKHNEKILTVISMKIMCKYIVKDGRVDKKMSCLSYFVTCENLNFKY